MKQTFKGFLSQYAKELTGKNTTSIKQLFLAMQSEAPRASEVILIYALSCSRENYLLKQANNTKYKDKYIKFIAAYKESRESLEDYLNNLPENNRYKKVWNAWESKNTCLYRDREMLYGVKDAISDMLEQLGIKRSQAYKLLGLNKGNFYAFLKGDTSKLSRKTAIEAYKKLEQLAA